MVAYSFQPRFVEPIRAGTKRQTIRAARKNLVQHVGRHGPVLGLAYSMGADMPLTDVTRFCSVWRYQTVRAVPIRTGDHLSARRGVVAGRRRSADSNGPAPSDVLGDEQVAYRSSAAAKPAVGYVPVQKTSLLVVGRRSRTGRLEITSWRGRGGNKA